MKALTLAANIIQQNFLFRLYRYHIIDSIVIVKNFGLKELVRRRGLKFLLVIVGYYLVRDSLIYLVIPFCVAKGLF